MVKKPWLTRTRPWPEQVVQVSGWVPGSAPVPVFAGEGFFEADLVVIAQVRAARGPAALLALGAEEFREDVAEHIAEDIFRPRAARSAGSAAIEP